MLQLWQIPVIYFMAIRGISSAPHILKIFTINIYVSFVDIRSIKAEELDY